MKLWWGKYEYLDKLSAKIPIRGLVGRGANVLGSRSRAFAGTRTTPPPPPPTAATAEQQPVVVIKKESKLVLVDSVVTDKKATTSGI